MTKQDIEKGNVAIATMLDYRLVTPSMRNNPKNFKHAYWETTDIRRIAKVLCKEGDLRFQYDYNWMFDASSFIERLGYRFFIHFTEAGTQVAITDMAILKQDHEYLSGNLIVETGGASKEAIFLALATFAELYNSNKL